MILILRHTGKWILLMTAGIVLFSSCSNAQVSHPLRGCWQLSLTTPDAGQMDVIMDFDVLHDTKNTLKFSAFSERNIDKKIMGFWKSRGARWFTPHFKHGSLLQLAEGKIHNNDSMSAVLRSPMRNYYFTAKMSGNTLNGYLRDGHYNIVGLVSGVKGKPSLPLKNYPRLADSIIAFTESTIYDPSVRGTKSWKHFSSKLRKISRSCNDDATMIVSFFYYARTLPFTHFMLYRYDGQRPGGKNSRTRYVSLEEKKKDVLYLKIKSFAGSAEEMDSVFNIVEQKQYKTLIVDLRDNPGGSVEAGLAFTRRLVPQTVYGGIFLTQQYFRNHQTLPAVNEYQHFPHFSEANFDLILDGIHRQEGLCLKLEPKAPLYSGQLYVLVNNNTASTCEPIVYGLKQRKRAIIVGERTAGAMLNGEIFGMPDGFKLVVPTATYYTSDGYKIDKQGVTPDIAVPSKEALEKVLEAL